MTGKDPSMPQDQKTGKLYCDFTLITDNHPEAVNHPAWESFKREMDGRAYGRDPLTTAWYYYHTGWEANKAKPEHAPQESQWAETWVTD